MVRCHHQLNAHEFEQTLGDSEGPRSLACGSPWGHKELDMILVTEQQQLIKLVGWRGKRVLKSGCNGMLELMGLVETP